MAATAPVGRPDARDADELDRLPPLDGDATDGPEAPVMADDDLAAGEEGDAGGGGLDDSTPASSGLHPDVDAEFGDASAESPPSDARAGARDWLDEPSDNQALDIGGFDLVHGTLDGPEDKPRRVEGALVGDDADAPPSPDDDFAAGERADNLDLAAEDGPVDADEELRDEDLPALDADEHDTEGDDAALLDERLARGETSGPLGVPWSTKPWVRVGAPVGLRCATALACVPRGVLVAWQAESQGAPLLRVDLEGSKQGVRGEGLGAGPVRALAAEGAIVAALVDRPGSPSRENLDLLLSRNAAEQFETIDGDIDALQAVLASGRLWIASRSGGLASAAVVDAKAEGASRVGALVLERHEVPGRVTALAADGAGGIVASAVDRDGRPAALIWGASDGSIRWEGANVAFAPAARALATARETSSGPLVAARRAFVALADGGEVLRRGPDGVWLRACWEGIVTTLAFVDDEGTLLAATYSPADDATALVCLDVSVRPSIVGLVGASPDDPDSDGRAVALAIDDAHEVVWVAGAFGVAAFAKPTRP